MCEFSGTVSPFFQSNKTPITTLALIHPCFRFVFIIPERTKVSATFFCTLLIDLCSEDEVLKRLWALSDIAHCRLSTTTRYCFVGKSATIQYSDELAFVA